MVKISKLETNRSIMTYTFVKLYFFRLNKLMFETFKKMIVHKNINVSRVQYYILNFLNVDY